MNIKECSTLIDNMNDDKQYTFRIEYTGVDDFHYIEFCAGDKNEALNLFDDYCVLECNLNSPVEPTDVYVVYNKCDAEYYGECYGTPEYYERMASCNGILP